MHSLLVNPVLKLFLLDRINKIYRINGIVDK